MEVAGWAVVAAGPILLLGWAVYSSVMSDKKDLKDNWVQYRCHPLYMPFASTIEPSVSTAENFEYCMTLFTHSIFSYALEPIHAMFGMVSDGLGDMEGDLGVFRNIAVKLQSFVLSFASNVFGKILNTMGVLLQELVTVRDVVKRITGSSAYAAMIVDATAQSIMAVFEFALGIIKALIIMIFALSVIVALFFPEILAFTIPLGVALGISFCFAPDTLIRKKNGETVLLKDIGIGDVLEDGSIVEGIFHFNCPDEIELYTLDGVIVSGGHLVLHNGVWKSVYEHPDARKYTGTSPDKLICLITDTHHIPIHSTTFADYEETSDPIALAQIEKVVYGRTVGEEMVGLDPDMPIDLDSGVTKPLHEIKLDDILAGGETVVGIVWLDAEDETWVERKGVRMLISQPCSEPSARAVNGGPRAMQIVVSNEQGVFRNRGMLFRDYLDTHDPAKLSKIEDIVMATLNR